MLKYLSKRPMLISALGCVILSLCAFYSSLLLLAFTTIFSLLLGISIFSKTNKLTIAFILILVMACSCFHTLHNIKQLENYNAAKIDSKLTVIKTTYKSSYSYNTDVEIYDCDFLPSGTKLALWHEPMILNSGEIIQANIKISKVSNKKINYSEGVFLNGRMSNITPTGHSDSVLTFLDKTRNKIKDIFFECMDYECASTASALVLGNKSYFTNDFYSNVKGSGTAHIMVVSGLHLSILVSLILKPGKKKFYNAHIRALTIFIVVTVISSLCGFTMSILRAGVTYIIMSLGLVLDRAYSGENALGTAVTGILIISPFAVLNVAFVLSVLSTFGILAIALPISKFLTSRRIVRNKFLKAVVETAVVSLSATLLTLPVTINTFGYVSTVGVITNLLLTYPVTLCLSLAVLGVIFYPLLPILGKFILFVTEFLLKYINGIINYFGSTSFSTISTPAWVSYLSIALIILIFCVLLACKKQIDMVKLKTMNDKIFEEGGNRRKWQLFLKRR